MFGGPFPRPGTAGIIFLTVKSDLNPKCITMGII